MQPRFVIGLDLGTTNCAVSFADTAAPGPVRPFPVLQAVNPGDVRAEPLLPSALYLHGAGDFGASAIELPWDPDPSAVTGRLALRRGSEVPRRLITSAKSWLSYSGVDRTAAILPSDAPEGVARVSPVEASRRYLEHIRRAWEHEHPDAPLANQEVFITVPASFDPVARELTERAAEAAGFAGAILIEEPQAAFYAWIERHEDWRERVRPGDLVLVVDVGGGTTDFSLIAVTDRGGEMSLERVAVGEHILLGGDNMDLALAAHLEREIVAKGKRLETQQRNALWQSCRAAKEKLLDETKPSAEHPIAILGAGTGLVGGTIKTKLLRSDVERLVLDGFFPPASSADMPVRPRRSGLQEVGLPYAPDTAITRHLARFLRRNTADGELARPTHVLFNGGVFGASPLRTRLLETLNAWLAADGAAPASALEGEDLMHAVSRGAAYYGLARRGGGVRIRGGIPRTYYVGIESSMPAIPGMPAPWKALTVAQFGMEEGTSVRIEGREFGLIVGEPAEFRFLASVERKDDVPGSLLEEPGDQLTEMAPMEVALPSSGDGSEVVTVTLESAVTETGQLQLWCVARDGRRWKLEFNVRESARS